MAVREEFQKEKYYIFIRYEFENSHQSWYLMKAVAGLCFHINFYLKKNVSNNLE